MEKLVLEQYTTMQPRVKHLILVFAPYQQSLNDGVSVFALIVHYLDVVQISISPVDQPVDQVQSDAVWEDNFTVHQLCSVLSIHVTSFHLWDLPVVGEENLSVEGNVEKGVSNHYT